MITGDIMSDNQIKGNLVERAAIYVVCIAAAIMIAVLVGTYAHDIIEQLSKVFDNSFDLKTTR